MAKRIMLIINPKAGKGGYRNELADILDSLCADGASVTIFYTRHSGHATELALSYGADFDTIACIGGDGTLAETISGVMALEARPPIGYIPMGTANDMATTFGLPKDAAQAATVIRTGRPTAIDVGLFNKQHFAYIAAFGAFTEVAYETPAQAKQMMGHFAYVLEGFSRLTKIKPQKLTVSYNGGEISGEYIFGAVSNTTSIAGFLKLRSELVDLGDGAFEVILVKNPSNIIGFNQMLLDVMTRKYDTEHIQIFRAKDIHFHFESPTAWTCDGEDGGVHTDVHLHALQPGVQILLPRAERINESF